MFTLVKKGELCYYKIDSFEETGMLKHCFTTKLGGVSKGAYESLNLRLSAGDSLDNVLKNYDIICNELGIDKSELVLSKQVHETNIVDVTAKDKGNGLLYENKFTSADALVTAEKNVPIVTFFADCVPVFLLDTKNAVLALVHSGWKGTIGEITAKTLKHMSEHYKTNPTDVLAAVGPSIRSCHYEVSDELASQFEEKFGNAVVHTADKKRYLNLQKCIEIQLISYGVPSASITDSGICTYCQKDIFYSHRYLGNERGTMAAIAMLV